jgi:hypothetical protein
MKVILFDATGMVGQGVLRECLLAPEVESVLCVGQGDGEGPTSSCGSSGTRTSSTSEDLARRGAAAASMAPGFLGSVIQST